MCKFPHLFEPLKLNDKYTMRNRVCCAPMAFSIISAMPYSFHCMLLVVVYFVSILTGWGRKFEK